MSTHGFPAARIIGLRQGLVVFAYIPLLVVMYALNWASYRGLDFTDESFYLIGYLRSVEPTYGFSYFHRIFFTIFGELELTIVEIRIIGFLAALIAGCVLSHSILLFLSRQKLVLVSWWMHACSCPIVAIAALLGYSWLPITLSYNSMSSIIQQLVLASFLYALSTRNNVIKVVLYVILGGLLGASLFNKFPNFFTSVFSMIVFKVLWHKRNPFSDGSIRFITPIVLGFAIFSWVLFGSAVTNEFVMFFQSLWSPLPLAEPVEYFSVYSNDFKTLVMRLLGPIISLTIFIIARLFLLSSHSSEYSVTLLDLVMFISLIGYTFASNSFTGGAENKYSEIDIYLIVLAIVMVVLLQSRIISQEAKWKIMLLGMFVLSFSLSAIGTGNGLSVQFTIYGAFFVAATVVFAIATESLLLFALIGLIAVVACSQIVTGLLLNPYRERHGMFNQNLSISVAPEFSELKVDSAKAIIALQLRQIRMASPQYLYAYAPDLGLILLSGKVPYAFGWCEEDPKICAELILREKYISPKDIVFALPAGKPVHQNIIQALRCRGISFPEEYKILKEIRFENCQLEQRAVDFFIHKSIKSISSD